MKEDNIELFDNYICDRLGAEEKLAFESRIASDKEFALDYEAYLLTVRGVCQEAQQDNTEFGHAMKNISREQLMKIIGSKPRSTGFPKRANRSPFFRERVVWIASVAALFIIGVMAVFNVNRSARYEMDNIVFEYNYVPSADRGTGRTIDISTYNAEELEHVIPDLLKQYADAPVDDIQARQDAGMQLAMAYLKLHDRKWACEYLEEMKSDFADDSVFVARCNLILSQIKK